MWRINFYKEKLLLLGSVIGSFGTVLSVTIPLLIASQIISWWMIVLIVTFVVLMVLAMTMVLIVVLKSDTPTKVYKIEDKWRIRNYMFHWISIGGRVAIWTRDMSWVEDAEMNQLLRRKSEAKELIICLPRDNDKSNSLNKQGAEVFAYGGFSDSPGASFTIVNYDHPGSRVAVSMRRGNLHIIQEFSADDHPAFHMAQKLVGLVREQNRAGE